MFEKLELGASSLQDDFAMVLMEDANGESIFLTEGLPSEKHFKARPMASLKVHGGGQIRGGQAACQRGKARSRSSTQAESTLGTSVKWKLRS